MFPVFPQSKVHRKSKHGKRHRQGERHKYAGLTLSSSRQTASLRFRLQNWITCTEVAPRVYPASSVSACGGQYIGSGLVSLWLTLIVMGFPTALASLALLGNCAVLVWQVLRVQVVVRCCR